MVNYNFLNGKLLPLTKRQSVCTFLCTAQFFPTRRPRTCRKPPKDYDNDGKYGDLLGREFLLLCVVK